MRDLNGETDIGEVDAVVIGGGKYGLEAVEYLMRKSMSFVLFDSNPKCLAASKLGLRVNERNGIVVGGIEKVAEIFDALKPDLVFPTAPVHVAAEMIRIKLGYRPEPKAVDCILPSLPQKLIVSAGRGGIVLSYNRDYDCIPKCSAPDICPVTKIKKPCPMYELVRFAIPDGFLLVSHQIEPGLGAIKGEDVRNAIRWAEKREEVIVATACRCHGVISALRRSSLH